MRRSAGELQLVGRLPSWTISNQAYLLPFQPIYLASDWLPISLLVLILIA